MPVDALSRQPMNAATNAIATTEPITPSSASSREPDAPLATAPITKSRAAAISQMMPEEGRIGDRDIIVLFGDRSDATPTLCQSRYYRLTSETECTSLMIRP